MSLWVPAGLLVGLCLGWVAWVGLGLLWASPVLSRTNFRDRQLPVGGGLVVIAAVIAAGSALIGWRAVLPGNEAPRAAETLAMLSVVLAAAGFGLLGLVDDLLGTGGARGLRGHVREARKGRITTGAFKLLGGMAVAAVCVGSLGPQPVGRFLIDVVLVAAAANLVNLFDLAPGRAIKWAGLAFLPLGIVWWSSSSLYLPGVAIGAALALLIPDLRERVMLGDTGANPLGAVLGLAVVIQADPDIRLVVALVVVMLNLVSEVVSFGRVIDRVPPLRAFDRIGRMP